VEAIVFIILQFFPKTPRFGKLGEHHQIQYPHTGYEDIAWDLKIERDFIMATSGLINS